MEKIKYQYKYFSKIFSIRTLFAIIKLLFNDIISLLVYRKMKNEIDNPSVGWLYFDQINKNKNRI